MHAHVGARAVVWASAQGQRPRVTCREVSRWSAHTCRTCVHSRSHTAAGAGVHTYHPMHACRFCLRTLSRSTLSFSSLSSRIFLCVPAECAGQESSRPSANAHSRPRTPSTACAPSVQATESPTAPLGAVWKRAVARAGATITAPVRQGSGRQRHPTADTLARPPRCPPCRHATRPHARPRARPHARTDLVASLFLRSCSSWRRDALSSASRFLDSIRARRPLSANFCSCSCFSLTPARRFSSATLAFAACTHVGVATGHSHATRRQ